VPFDPAEEAGPPSGSVGPGREQSTG
jgi:hypothetical protein